jgi:sodium/pantothenate symporter
VVNPEVVTYTWIGLVLFILMCFVLGYIGGKKTRTLIDFTIGGARLGPFVLGVAFAATFFSAATFTGYVGWVYAWGFSAIWVFLAIFVASTFGILTFARKVREANIKQKSHSLPDWLGDFYNSDFLRMGTGVLLLFNLFYIGSQFTGGAYVFNVLLGWSYHSSLALIVAVVILYVVAGGTFADVYTDTVQGLLMSFMGLFCFVSGVLRMGPGGWSSLTETLRSIDPNMVALFNPESTHFYAGAAVLGVFIIEYAFAAQPQLFNKVLALKNPSDLRKMILTYVTCAFCMMLVIFVGLFAHQFGVHADVPDHTIYLYVASMFPPIVSAMLAMVILSACLSTTDGILVVLATLFSNDVYRKFLVKRGYVKVASEEEIDRKGLLISRVATIVVGLAAAALVINPPAFIGTFIWIGISGIASGTMGPLIVGIFMKDKVTPLGAILSMFIGVISYLILSLGGFERSVMVAGAWAVCIAMAFMIAFTLLFPRTKVKEKQPVAG